MLPNSDRHIGTILHDQNGDQRYVLQNRLGAGGMGAVYRGLDRRDQRLVAIKVVESTISPDHVAEFAKEGGRFQQEVLTLQGLEHPHIVPLLGSGVDRQAGLFYLVMDIAEEGSLRERIKKLRRLPPSETVLHIHEAAAALQYAHDHHTIHMDVKPDNFLLKNIEGSWVLVSDFGIAGVKHDPQTVVTAGFQGTLVYASPEQVRGKPTKFTDQWALAVTAYEALTGVRPFQQADILALAVGQAVEPPTFLDLGITDALHVQLEGVLRRGLKKDQEKRYPEITELSKALEENFLIVASDPEQRIFLAAKLPSLPNIPTTIDTRHNLQGQEEHDLFSAPTVPDMEVAKLIEQGRKEKDAGIALQAFDQALAIEPTNQKALFWKIFSLSSLKKPEEALQVCDQILSFEPKNLKALDLKVIFLHRLGRYEEEIEVYDQMLSVDSTNISTIFQKANLLAELGRYEEEIQAYNQAFSLYPMNKEDALWRKVLFFHRQARYEAAIQACDEMIKLYPQYNNGTLYYKISALRELGKHEEILKVCDEMSKLGHYDYVLPHKVDALYALGGFEEVVQACDEMIRLNPQNSAAFKRKGLVLGELGRLEEAIQAFEEEIRLTRRNIEAFRNKGNLLRVIGREEEAKRAFARAEKIEKEEEEGEQLINLNALRRQNRLNEYKNEATEIFSDVAIKPYKNLDPEVQAIVQQIVIEQYSLGENEIQYPDESTFRELSAITLQLAYSGFPEIAKKAYFTDEVIDFDTSFQEAQKKELESNKNNFSFFILLEDGSIVVLEGEKYNKRICIYSKLKINSFDRKDTVSGENVRIDSDPKREELLAVTPSHSHAKIKKIFVTKEVMGQYMGSTIGRIMESKTILYRFAKQLQKRP